MALSLLAPTIPETKYARNGEIHLAYQTLGTGPPDLLGVSSGPLSHVEQIWEQPAVARVLRRLASYGRLILFDQRGTGLSDPVAPHQVPRLEEHVEDMRVILDEVGSRRAVVLGYAAGGAPAMMFAATHPERVESLILWTPYARLRVDDDYPSGATPEVVDRLVGLTLAEWGKGASIPAMAPSMANDERFRAWAAQMERLAASPGTAADLIAQWHQIDVRRVLPAIRVPTLVLSLKNQPVYSPMLSRYVADHIPGARFVELEGTDLLAVTNAMFPAIADFLGASFQQSDPDRSLGTVLFTDIVGSTAIAARIGDLRWRDLLEAHDRILNRQVERYRGQLIKTTGDGALVLFDGPARAIACAEAIRDALRAIGLVVRAGLHSGELEEREDGDIGGIAVHIGARIAALAGPGEILVSRTIKDLVAGSSLRLESRGTHQLKGVPESWEVFAVMA